MILTKSVVLADVLIGEIEKILARETCDTRNFPGYQTRDIANHRAFEPIVESFIRVCEKINCYGSRVQMWAYKDNKKRQQEYGHDRQWHDHNKPGNVICGVMYLRNTDGVGTEFESGLVTSSNLFVWNLFHPSMTHRPAQLFSNSWRYSLAANYLSEKNEAN